MANLKVVLPDAVIKEFERVYNSTEEIFGAMTRAGASVVASNVKAGVPKEEMSAYVKLTKTYRTPTDGGINTKVYLSGYMPFKGNRTTFARRGRSGGAVYVSTKGIPVDFLAKIYEYGRSNAPFPKKPFLRRAFNAQAIEKAMLDAQKEASGGLLE